MSVSPGIADRVTSRVIANEATHGAVLSGTRSGVEAFLEGDLRVRGNLALALRLDSILGPTERPARWPKWGTARAAGVDTAFLEAGEGPPVVLLHGLGATNASMLPTLWDLARDHRAIAPDLPGFGDSPPDPPGTWRHHVETLEELRTDQELERVALVGHDWGGLIGLRWACDHPDAVWAVVASDTGFFADGRWHGMAEAVRSEQGEQIVAAIDRAGFEGLLRSSAPFGDEDIEAYWRPFAEGRGQRATLDFYRSMDFSKLAPYDGCLAGLGVPTLLLWGADDEFAPIAGARRFEREIPGARLVAIEGAGHFVFDQEPERCAREVVSFLESAA
jgi:haloalkane dehalogenase